MEKEDFLSYQLELEKLMAARQEQLSSRIQALDREHASRADALLRELNDARLEIINTKQSLTADLEKSKAEIAEVAVDRTLKLFAEAKGIVQTAALCLIPIVFGAGYLAYSSLKSTTTMFVDSKVKEWLSLSTTDSPVKMALEDLRTQTVLDALTVKLARQEAEGRRSRFSFGEFAQDEIRRLHQILLNPASTRPSFIDAAKLIAASREGLAGINVDPDMANTVNVILSGKDFDNERKSDLFDIWWKDRVFTPQSIAILDGGPSRAGEAWSLLAFKNLERNASGLATSHASALLAGQSEALQLEAADYLAGADPLHAGLANWMERYRAAHPDKYPAIQAALASNASSYLSKHHDVNVMEASSARLFAAIQAGARLRLMAWGMGENVRWEKQVKDFTYAGNINDMRAYFENDGLLTGTLRRAGHDVPMLAGLVSAMEVLDGEQPLATIEMSLGENSALLLEKPAGALHKADAVGPVRLHAVSAGKLMATWRQPNGEYVSSAVTGGQFGDATYSYAYDRYKVGQIDLRRVNEYFQ